MLTFLRVDVRMYVRVLVRTSIAHVSPVGVRLCGAPELAIWVMILGAGAVVGPPEREGEDAFGGLLGTSGPSPLTKGPPRLRSAIITRNCGGCCCC